MSRLLFTCCCIAIATIMLFAFLTGWRSPVRAGTLSDSPQEKTVEQVRKNIQVLKGMPASQLNPLMDYFAASLGVRCDHCHSLDSMGQGFEKDDLKPKGTARRMIQMVMDLNAKNFAGRTEVSCFTCHNGNAEPVKMISLPRPPAKPEPEEEEGRGLALPDAGQVIAMYEKALGGADAMGKIKSRIIKGVSVDSRGMEAPMEMVQEAPDKFSVTVTMKEGMQSTRAFNGNAGWMVSPRGSRPMPPDQAEEMRKDAALFPVSVLKAMSEKLHVRGTEKVEGATAYVLAGPGGEHASVRYYIDSATGLLVRKVTITETMVANIPEQVDYSSYGEADGVKVPFLIRNSGVDPRHSYTRRVTSVENNATVDEKKFVMPEMKPPPRGR